MFNDDTRSRAAVQKKRADKRSHAEGIGIDEAFISDLVETFYGAVRSDDLLGPIFAERITKWPIHLEQMKRFWRSILYSSGEFTGSPMAKHMAIPELGKVHFERWLTLFYQTLRDLEVDPEATTLIGQRARMIGESLLSGIALQGGGMKNINAGKNLPHI